MRFFQADSTKVSHMGAGAASLRKSHDIVILSFCNIVKGQAKCIFLKWPIYVRNISLKNAHGQGKSWVKNYNILRNLSMVYVFGYGGNITIGSY